MTERAEIVQDIKKLREDLEEIKGQVDPLMREQLEKLDREIHEVVREEGEATKLKKNLEAAATEFAVNHPEIEGLLRRAAYALGRMGI